MNGIDPNAEWLEPDGLGGFASGTIAGIRSRRYHALLLTATKPPAGRIVLVNGFDAWVETSAGTYQMSSQRYAPDVVHPNGSTLIEAFDHTPWPRWRFRLTNNLAIQQEIFVGPGESAVYLSWRLVPVVAAAGVPGAFGVQLREETPPATVTLRVRPFLSGRDFHSVHHENGAFQFSAEKNGQRIYWRLYDGLPRVVARSNGDYSHQPDWYRNFLYLEEQARGLDSTEDLASPGVFTFSLSADKPAVLMFAAEDFSATKIESIEARYAKLSESERRRRENFAGPLERAADAYLVKRGSGKTLIAGYPWFGDWGRDTFISLRGLCIATNRLGDARDILVEWAGTVSEGMLPNRFPDSGEQPEFNSVDASLWYVIAVGDYLRAAEAHPGFTDDCHTAKLRAAVEAILAGYSSGTRFGIRASDDGLLAAGESGLQLTWMDARVEGREITPRIGKPVEIQALWLNALAIGAQFSDAWASLLAAAQENFERRFWNEQVGYLADVVDCNHHVGEDDLTLRPNQIFAVGGLPLSLLSEARATRVVEVVEKSLLTPVGLRSLASDAAGYTAHYQGSVAQRDGSYHQGTVWPWLIGAFVEAWARVRGNTEAAKQEAREKFLPPLYRHLEEGGLGHISEICDAEPPHTPRGCPFQAWSLGELLRLEKSVLA